MQSAAGNVSGIYPSRKMGRTIQFESHRNELAAILEMEHDPETCEFWDQPQPIKLHYQTPSGKRLGVLRTPDYFVLRRDSAAWIECKTEEQLKTLSVRQPHRFQYDQTAQIWRCPPGKAYATPLGLSYRVRSSAEIDWIYQRNVLFLEDFLRAETLEVSIEALAYFRSLAAREPGLPLSDLLTNLNQHGIPTDSLYIAIVTDRLYVDLTAAALAQPECVRVYLDQTSARLYEGPDRRRPAASEQQLSSGSVLDWDGKRWEVINHGESQTWLRDGAGPIISLSEAALSDLLARGAARIIRAPPDEVPSARQSAKDLLAAASPSDLMEANG